MGTDIDTSASVGLCAALAVVLAVFVVVSILSGPRTYERLEREAPLPLVGKAPMEAVYAAIGPVARLLVAVGVSANTVTVAALVLASVASVLFALGHFGLGTAFAVSAALADALDGLVARESGTVSRFGRVLDTTIDRYVEAMLIGGIAIFVREDLLLLLLALAALVGGFMVSYASSVLRELEVTDEGAPMRRVERLTWLLLSTMIVPFVASAGPELPKRIQLAPVLLALGAIAFVGNVSAMRRLLNGARESPQTVPAPASNPTPATPPAAPSTIRSPALKGSVEAPASKHLRHP